MRDRGAKIDARDLFRQNDTQSSETATSTYLRAVRLSLRRSKLWGCAAGGVLRDWEVTNTTGVVILLAHLGPLRLTVASEGAAAHVDACHTNCNFGI